MTESIWWVQRVRRRPERGALRFRDLVWPKPLGPNRIRRLGYYRPCCRWATEARGTRSAFTHVLTEARLPGVLNQHLPHTDYLTSAVGGCIYPFCIVRTNRCSTILHVCCRDGGWGDSISQVEVFSGDETWSSPSRHSSSHMLHEFRSTLLCQRVN